MTLSRALRAAREEGIAGLCGADGGVASPAVVCLEGPDAASFLHGQVTNDVQGLDVGQGNLSARVSRTGHLQSVFSVHRVAVCTFWLLCAAEDANALCEQLESFHFADELRIYRLNAEHVFALIQGPAVAQVLLDRGGPEWNDGLVYRHEAGVVLGRSFTGDRGLVLRGPTDWLQRWLDAARQASLMVLDPAQLSAAIETLRVEAGLLRPVLELKKRRLLPGTGLEQRAVSYSKGCYLGQEVISRVRTYGSVPWALRALVFRDDCLGSLGAPGSALVLEDGAVVGELCSRARSEFLGRDVALAWVKREHRTPGSWLTVRGVHGLWPAEVALLPLYHAPDASARVAQDYDLAVKAFASGDTPAALRLLGHALSLDPTFADGYEVLGVILGRSGAYHEAIDFFKRLEEVAPAEPLVHTNLSLYYMKLGDTETAELHRALAVQKSLQGGDASRDAAELARDASESRKADARRKRAMFEQVLAFDPDDDIALLGAGRALSVLEDWPAAEALLLRAVQANARSSVAWLALGRAQEYLGKVMDASSTYERGISVASKRGELVPLKEMQNRRLLLVGGSDRSD